MKTEHQILVVFIVLFLLIVGFVAFVFFSNDSSYKYNGFKVQRLRQGSYLGYRTKLFVNDNPVYFNTRYGPKGYRFIKKTGDLCCFRS